MKFSLNMKERLKNILKTQVSTEREAVNNRIFLILKFSQKEPYLKKKLYFQNKKVL